MAKKRKSTKRVKRTHKVARVYKKSSLEFGGKNKRLSILLIILALLILALAALTMNKGGNQQTTNQVKVTASPSVKPTLKPAK